MSHLIDKPNLIQFKLIYWQLGDDCPLSVTVHQVFKDEQQVYLTLPLTKLVSKIKVPRSNAFDWKKHTLKYDVKLVCFWCWQFTDTNGMNVPVLTTMKFIRKFGNRLSPCMFIPKDLNLLFFPKSGFGCIWHAVQYIPHCAHCNVICNQLEQPISTGSTKIFFT